MSEGGRKVGNPPISLLLVGWFSHERWRSMQNDITGIGSFTREEKTVKRTVSANFDHHFGGHQLRSHQPM